MAHVFEKKWRSQDVQLEENVDFTALLLSERVLEGLTKAGFKKPSPIQLEAIPVGRFGKDLMVQAKSGTGKTLVFVIIALEMLKRKLFRPQILIVVPTREIATQVCSVVKAVGSTFHKLTCNTFIGGLPLFEDQEKAVMTQIVVGTPGRLKQLIQLKSLPTNSIRLLVFDEADELLNSNSFKNDLEDIFSSLPDEKQVLATSATFNPKVKKVMYRYLCNPHLVRLNVKQLALLGMVHYAQIVENCPLPVILYKVKLQALEKILKTVKFAQCLMFCNGIQRVEVLYRDVKRWGFSVAYISSAKEQCDRLKAMERLKRFKCKVLVSSDLTARGIDAENVDLVINFDLAYTSEIYLHRVGRAGRYGSVGVAISIIDDTETKYLQRIEKEGSFRAFMLPDPVPSDLILYPPEGEFAINEPHSGNVHDDSETKKSPKSNDVSWEGLIDGDCNLEKVNAESIHGNGVSETNVDENNACESELTSAADDDVEKEDFENEINLKNIQITDDFETCNDVDGSIIKYASSQLAVDVKAQDDNTKHNDECEKVDEDVASHSHNKNIHLNEQTPGISFQNGYANNERQGKNESSNLLNDCDQNKFFNSESTDKPSAYDIHENSDICDKNTYEKQGIVNVTIENGTQLINQFSNISSNLEKNDFEVDDNKLTKICTDDIPESSELIVKNLKDNSVNCEQVSTAKSCDVLSNTIKTFLDTYKSNKVMESNKLEAAFDKDNQLEENSGKKLITIDMINNLKSQKHQFLHKIFNKFQESKDSCLSSNKNEKEDNKKGYEGNLETNENEDEKEKSNENNFETNKKDNEEKINKSNLETNEKEDKIEKGIESSRETNEKEDEKEKSSESSLETNEKDEKEKSNESSLETNKKDDKEKSNKSNSETDLINEDIHIVQEKISENSEVENRENFSEKPIFESTPQLSDKIKQDTAEVTTNEGDCKPVLQIKFPQFFQELSSESSDCDDPESNKESSEVVKETSSISSASDSSASDLESSSLSSDSEDESGSETEASSSSSESSSDSSDSPSSTVVSENEDDENLYHHNYSRTGRQNPSLISGSARGQVLNDKIYYDKYSQDHRCTSCGGRKKEIPRDNSYFSQVIGNPPYFFDHREIASCSRKDFQTRNRRGQNFADHDNTQSSFPRKHSRCCRSRHSSRNLARKGDQSRNACQTHQRSPRHNHTLNCFLPTGHRCHPNTPHHSCRQGPLCEMWYKTFYNQWLHIQSVIN